MATRRVESFLVRIVVADNGDSASPRWHGRVQHIGTGLESRIDQLDELLAFITTHLNPAEPAPVTGQSTNPSG